MKVVTKKAEELQAGDVLDDGRHVREVQAGVGRTYIWVAADDKTSRTEQIVYYAGETQDVRG